MAKLLDVLGWVLQLKLFEGVRGYLGMALTALGWAMKQFPHLTGLEQVIDFLTAHGVVPQAIEAVGLYVTAQGYTGAKAKVKDLLGN